MPDFIASPSRDNQGNITQPDAVFVGDQAEIIAAARDQILAQAAARDEVLDVDVAQAQAEQEVAGTPAPPSVVAPVATPVVAPVVAISVPVAAEVPEPSSAVADAPTTPAGK